jgi:NitT/TauT family transport system substrate-binding protein
MTIRIGHLSTFYHTAILLQAQKDADQRIGEEIAWRLMPTGPAIVKAFEQGELDLAYIGLPPAIIGMSRDVNIICVAGGHMEGTVMAGKTIWAGYPEQPDLGFLLAQFKGHTIGVPGTGSIHDVILKDCLEQHGLANEVAIRNFSWADLVLEAVVKDEVAAAFGTPALAVAIGQYAGGKVLYPPSKLWPNNPSYGIVADSVFLERERDKVEAFLKLHEEAEECIRTRPRAAARLIADYVSIVDESFVMETLALSPMYCSKLTKEFIESTMRFIPVLKKLGFIKNELTGDRIFSTSLIEKVHPGAHHYGEGIKL